MSNASDLTTRRLWHTTRLSRKLHWRDIILIESLSRVYVSVVSQFLSIDNAMLDPIPKRLHFTMVKNTDYLGSVNTNPYQFRNYDLGYFALIVNGKQMPTEGLSLNMVHKKSPSWDKGQFCTRLASVTETRDSR